MKHRRLRVLTWHVHGNYLWYLTQVPHDFFLATDAARSMHHSGASGILPWGANVHEVPVEQIARERFDVVLYQSRFEWEADRHRFLSEAQRRGPTIYLEHDPPQAHPVDERHWVDDPNVLLVHCTPFNALMWDSGQTPVRVVEHGIQLLQPARYSGHVARGMVVVNNLGARGRRLGLDVYRDAAERVPLALYGMGSLELGGEGEVPNDRLPGTMAAHRFFFNPIRWTSLGLAILEAMMVGVPVVGLATTELASVIRDGANGFIDTRTERLVEAMQRLLDDPGLARQLGAAGQETARERFGIGRFVADWLDAFATVAG
ncbi:MAG TPA: glycosyltransferase family 4 protein [Caldimonas sp.]|nr:glycosyltransferase family 4 protein [Caldimonas sp.]